MAGLVTGLGLMVTVSGVVLAAAVLSVSGMLAVRVYAPAFIGSALQSKVTSA